jgi:hypothetical protein
MRRKLSKHVSFMLQCRCRIQVQFLTLVQTDAEWHHAPNYPDNASTFFLFFRKFITHQPSQPRTHSSTTTQCDGKWARANSVTCVDARCNARIAGTYNMIYDVTSRENTEAISFEIFISWVMSNIDFQKPAIT